MNCHSSGDFPRQGDDQHPHTMQVRRGPDGHGVNPVQCSSCHQGRNTTGLHTPPGAPGWHLPSPDTPVIWEGLTDRQHCGLLKDPSRNGRRSGQQIVEHMASPLVLWGWHPGDGLVAVPMVQGEFLSRVREWAAKGQVAREANKVSVSDGKSDALRLPIPIPACGEKVLEPCLGRTLFARQFALSPCTFP
jgi:hypothetical protein